MAIIGRLTSIAFGTIFALSGAVGPIIGQNYGARDFTRVRRALHDALLFTGIVVVVATVILFFLREHIAALFSAEGVSLSLFSCSEDRWLWRFSSTVCCSYRTPVSTIWVALSIRPGSTGGGIPWGQSHWSGLSPSCLARRGVLIGQAAGGVLFGVLSVVLVRHTIDADEPQGDASKGPRLFQRQARQIALFFGLR